MEKTDFTEAEIVKTIRKHDNGRDIKQLCRESRISIATFTNGVSEMGLRGQWTKTSKGTNSKNGG